MVAPDISQPIHLAAVGDYSVLVGVSCFARKAFDAPFKTKVGLGQLLGQLMA